MKKIKQNYGIPAITNVGFVDLYLGIDNPLFVDFNKIQMLNNVYSKEMQLLLDTFIEELMSSLFKNNTQRVESLFKGVHESNETYLGLSEGHARGNSIGNELAEIISTELKFIKDIMIKGNFDIDALFYGIDQIGPDRISDMVVSIIKLALIKFTQDQCVLLGIPMTTFMGIKYFDDATRNWEFGSFDLPEFNGKGVIFIPKEIVSTYTGISGNIAKFIRVSFNEYFKNNNKFVKEVFGKDSVKNYIKTNEFNEWREKNGYTNKVYSKKLLTSLSNEQLVNSIYTVRKSVFVLSDIDISEIVENNYQRLLKKKA